MFSAVIAAWFVLSTCSIGAMALGNLVGLPPLRIFNPLILFHCFIVGILVVILEIREKLVDVFLPG